MATLQELLLTPENAPHLIADTQALVDDQISSKGITAAPLKAAYKAVTAFAPGYYQEAVSAMLPGMVYQLEPYWADFKTSGGADFGGLQVGAVGGFQFLVGVGEGAGGVEVHAGAVAVAFFGSAGG